MLPYAIFLAIAIILFLIWWFGSPSGPPAGALPGGGTPSARTITQSWTTAPATVTVGAQATFTLTASDTATGSPVGVTGRQYFVAVVPSQVSIVSINGAAPPLSSGGAGTTAAGGTITVVVTASAAPTPATGYIVAGRDADALRRIAAAGSVTPQTLGAAGLVYAAFEVAPP